jgi:predicted acylesterase/phospholipase RssA
MAGSPESQALVLGGGGILGVAWEVGVLAALEERLGRGAIVRDFDLVVGSSAGAVVASLVGQGVPPHAICEALSANGKQALFRASDVCRVDWSHLVRGSVATAGRVIGAAVDAARHGRLPTSLAIFEAALNGLPAGFLRLDPLTARLVSVYRELGLADDFACTSKPLLVPALDINRGERILFGARSLADRLGGDVVAGAARRDPPLSVAVTASAAIPRLFGAIDVEGSAMVDGDIGGALHLDAALVYGVRRILAISPVAASCLPVADEGCGCRPVSQGGLGELLDQSARIEHEHAVSAAIDAVRARWTDARIVLLKPSRTEMPKDGPMAWGGYRAMLDLARRGLDRLDAATLQSIDSFARRPPPTATDAPRLRADTVTLARDASAPSPC